jgi:hypothetical protein
MFYSPPDYLHALALKEAEATPMRGYTEVRDISGSVQGSCLIMRNLHTAGRTIAYRQSR